MTEVWRAWPTNTEKIRRMECLRKDEDWVWFDGDGHMLRPMRVARIARGVGYFDSEQEARDWCVEQIKQKITRLKTCIEQYQHEINEVMPHDSV